MKWFTSDSHFAHEKIAQARGFSSSEEHDTVIIAAINSLVCERDTLFILGDFCWGRPGKYRMKIKCKDIRYILGNHDKLQETQSVFGQVHTVLKTRIVAEDELAYGKAVLCHFPMAFWDASHNKSWHLYGHTHGSREETLDAAFPGRQAMDVGLDNIKRLYGCYRPINENEVFDYMAARTGHDHKEFYDGQRAGSN